MMEFKWSQEQIDNTDADLITELLIARQEYQRVHAPKKD